jgi:hypothetical protein
MLGARNIAIVNPAPNELRGVSIQAQFSDAFGTFSVHFLPETIESMFGSLMSITRRKNGTTSKKFRAELSDQLIGLWSEIELLRSRSPDDSEIHI